MRVFLTGGTGFLGGRVAAILRARGDDVVALARSTSDTAALRSIGATIANGDVTDRESVRRAIDGAAIAIHVAAWYELGVKDVARMEAINVEGARNVLELAKEMGARSIVHCSSVAALGSTGGAVVDEEHARSAPFGSTYERTKSEAHAIARSLGARIGSPGTIFGPGDHSLVAELVRAHLAGVLLAAPFPELTMSLVFVDDAARGLIAIADRGRDGRAYNLVGEVITMGDWIARMAEITGRAAPRARIPTFAVRAAAKTFPFVAGLAGLGPSLAREGLAMADGASWAFSSRRAREELGWTTTDFDEAIARTVIAFDRRRGDRFRPTSDRGRRALAIARGETRERAEAAS